MEGVYAGTWFVAYEEGDVLLESVRGYNAQKSSQKKEITYGWKGMNLLVDTILNLGGIDVGTLNIRMRQIANGGWSRVFFLNIGVGRVVLWIFDDKKYGEGEVSTVSDCIVNSFRLER